MRRQRSQTLPTGQTVTHTYGLGSAPGASWPKVTAGIAPNLRCTRTVFDGFGRPLEVTTGHQVNGAETPVSKVKTEYTPSACSSIGKVLRVTPPGNAGFTSYEYGGTTVKTIDPMSKGKKFENDALGNLIRVWEPRPGGGPDYETTYTYTILRKLSTVTMTRPGKGLNPATITQEVADCGLLIPAFARNLSLSGRPFLGALSWENDAEGLFPSAAGRAR